MESGYGLRVRVLRTDGSELPCLIHNGVPYVIAEPGQAFTVEASRGRGDGFTRSVQVDLNVDRRGVGYNKLVPQGASTRFEGFLVGNTQTSSHAGISTYKEFMFAKPNTSGAAAAAGERVVQHLDDIASGRLRVTFFNVRQGEPMREVPRPVPVDQPAAEKLPEGKKWFLAPSLQTAAGKANSKSTSWSTHKFHKVGQPVWDLELRYETADTLMLRQVLKLDVPAHRQLLMGSRDPYVMSLLAQEPSCRRDRCAANGNSAPSPSARGREAGGAPCAPLAAADPPGGRAGAGGAVVKRERGGGAGGGGSGAGGSGAHAPQADGVTVVDLTRLPMPPPLKLEGGREVRRDEIVICDLCGEDDGGAGADAAPGKWRVTKRPCIEVSTTTRPQ